MMSTMSFVFIFTFFTSLLSRRNAGLPNGIRKTSTRNITIWSTRLSRNLSHIRGGSTLIEGVLRDMASKSFIGYIHIHIHIYIILKAKRIKRTLLVPDCSQLVWLKRLLVCWCPGRPPTYGPTLIHSKPIYRLLF